MKNQMFLNGEMKLFMVIMARETKGYVHICCAYEKCNQ
jgi:hypothetical protein